MNVQSLVRDVFQMSCVFTALVIMACNSAMAVSDVNKEKRIADQTLETLFIGEAVWLEGNNKFLALENNEVSSSVSQPPSGSVILLIHGSGQGPDTPFVIAPLRELLAERGYPTLSIQMPVLSENTSYADYQTTLPDARSRIIAAIEYLKKQQKNRITIVAHSLGSAMLMDWVGQEDLQSIESIVTLGLGAHLKATELEAKLEMQQHYEDVFKKVTIPFLDAYGENDYKPVLASASLRKEAVKNTHIKSQQMMISGGDHFFADIEETLVERIIEWLD